MSEGVCLQCGSEMPYDWAPCPNCGWKAPDTWEADEEPGQNPKTLQVALSKRQPWIGPMVWILITVLLLGLVYILWRHT
jgi:hypothetical protein